jgi:actinin alpha
MESLRVGVESLLTSINKTINSFENSLIIANSKKKTDEQLNEHRRSFNHFDKDNKGLTEEQLRSFLISIGHNQDEKFKKILHKLGSTTDQSDRFDFDSIMGQLNLGNKDICIQMCDAFRVLANGKPHIKPEDLRRELSPKQAEDCLKAMDDYFDHLTGQYNFESFCKSFYSS